MKNLIFSDEDYFKTSTEFTVILKNSTNKIGLLKELYSKLMFPSYFGFNWDALYDCLRDFHWLDYKNVVIVHKELPNLGMNDLKIYLEILQDSIEDWKEGDSHSLKVVFPSNKKEHIKKVLQDH